MPSFRAAEVYLAIATFQETQGEIHDDTEILPATGRSRDPACPQRGVEVTRGRDGVLQPEQEKPPWNKD